MSVSTVPQHVFTPSHQRPSVFVRAWHHVRDWFKSTRFYAVWAEGGRGEDESYESGAGWPTAAPASRVEAPTVPGTAPRPQPAPEKPLVYLPAPPQDVLRNIAHDVMDMLGRDVSAYDVFEAMTRHMVELKKRHQQLRNLERRSVSNVAETQMDASLLAAADRRGESAQELAERAERVAADMLARAKRASDPAPTQALPVITEDMPDPRESGPESVPLPSVPFLTAAEASAGVAVANEAMALRTPVAPVEVEPDRPWTAKELSEDDEASPDEPSEEFLAANSEQATAGSAVSA